MSTAEHPPTPHAPAAAAATPRVVVQKRTGIREDALNLPNLLTMLRIVLIPAVLWLITEGTPEGNFWAAIVYSVSAITDFIDGYLARRMKLVSVLGRPRSPSSYTAACSWCEPSASAADTVAVKLPIASATGVSFRTPST